MAQLTITMRLDNAAFAEDADVEVGRILATIAVRLDGHIDQDYLGHIPKGTVAFEGKLRDFNGNSVGEFALKA